MNVKCFVVVTLFLVLGLPCSLAARVSVGRSSVSFSRSSVRSSSSVSFARSSSVRTTYGGSRYTVISARAYVYGYSAYTTRGSGNNDPTVCFNNGTLSGLQDSADNESTPLGYYVCPLPGDSDSMYCCCGAQEAQYCCSSWDYTMMNYSGEVFGAAGAVLVLVACGVGVYLKRKFKRRASRVRQHGHAEATRQEVRPPPHGTNWSAGATICPREDINGRCRQEPVTSFFPSDLNEGSQVTAKHAHVQCPGDVQLPRYEGNAPIQMPPVEPLPPKYEDVILASNNFAVRSSSQ